MQSTYSVVVNNWDVFRSVAYGIGLKALSLPIKRATQGADNSVMEESTVGQLLAEFAGQKIKDTEQDALNENCITSEASSVISGQQFLQYAWVPAAE